MTRILRRINDNRVSIPGDLLKLLDINKGDTVELIHVNNQIVIQKVENLDELNESPNTNFNSSFIDDTYKLRLSKRKEIDLMFICLLIINNVLSQNAVRQCRNRNN